MTIVVMQGKMKGDNGEEKDDDSNAVHINIPRTWSPSYEGGISCDGSSCEGTSSFENVTLSASPGNAGSILLLPSNRPFPPPSSEVKPDKMQRLKLLKELYDQGFLTVTEYKDRKSQIVDELTGTHTRTNSHKHKPPVIVASPPPDFSTISEETAYKHVYDTAKNSWATTLVKVKLDSQPFACGGLRKCYHLHDCSSPEESYVAKLAIDPFEDLETYITDVEIQMHCKVFANKFNEYNPPKKVDFVMTWLLELTEREDRPICGVEKFIEGPYRKHNNNYGYVSEDERNTPQAFSHFTYEASDHQILICDIQGVADLYTDPQMHTVEKKQGKGNMGISGINKFLATHQCNAICRYLKLPSINAKVKDTGTVPATTYMPDRKIDFVNFNCHLLSIPPRVYDNTNNDITTPFFDPGNSAVCSNTVPVSHMHSRAWCGCSIL